MSISESTPIATAQEDNHVAKETCTDRTVDSAITQLKHVLIVIPGGSR
jgi:hypothetical protein